MATNPWTWNPTTQRWTNAATGQTMTALAYSAYQRGVPPPTGSNASFNFGQNNSGYGQGGGPGGQEGGGIFGPTPGPATGPFGPTVPFPGGPTTPTPTPTPPGQPPTDTRNPPKPTDRNTWQQILDAILGRSGPGKGGTLPAILGLLGNLGRNAASLEAGRAAGRVGEANISNQYDRTNLLRNQQYGPRAETELDQRKYIDERYQRNLANATWGAALPNIHDFQITGLPDRVASHIPTSTGGLRPSLVSDADAAAIGGQAYRDAQLAFLNPLSPGTAPEGTPNRLAALPEPPPLTPMPEANAFDTALNYLSLIGLVPGSRPNTTNTTTNTSTTTPTDPNANNPYADLTMPTAPANRQPDTTSDTTVPNPRTQTASIEPTMGVNVGAFAPMTIDRPGDLFDPNKALLPRISPYAYAQPFGRTA